MTIYICGDSTAASYTPEKAPITGWGQVLGQFLPGVEIINHAFAGRSSKSFLAEGRLQPVEEHIRPGDLLLIQFTHNDRNPRPERHTDPDTTFPAHTVRLDPERRMKAHEQPVIMTIRLIKPISPVMRRIDTACHNRKLQHPVLLHPIMQINWRIVQDFPHHT